MKPWPPALGVSPATGRRLRTIRPLAVVVMLAGLAACQDSIPFGDHDRDAGLTRDDFRDALAPREAGGPAGDAGAGPAIPLLQPLVDLPRPVSSAERRLVSVAVNETVPLKDVLIELARKARVDLELDPRIEGGIILTMRDRPLGEVIGRIADLAGLRYQFHGKSLRIELDEPYYLNYRLDYLDLTRQASSSVETSTNVMSHAGVDGNASSSAVSGQSDQNFWQELETSLAQILLNSQPRRLTVVPAAAPLPVARPPGSAPARATPATIGDGGATTVATDPPSPGETSAYPGEALVDSLIGQDDGDDDAGSGVAPEEAEAPGAGDLFTVNRQAGLVSVFGTDSQHRLVEAYLAELRASISRQVLIEAKIFEVALSDEFRSGINWRAVMGDFSIAAPLGPTVVPPPFGSTLDATRDVITLALDTNDLDVIASFIQRFGTVRTLSSPRIAVLHNQTAVLKVAENQVFFRLFFERIEEDDGDDQVNINSEIRTVPVGVIVTVQPSIDADTEQVSLALRPTVTRVVDVVEDPAVAIASNNTVASLIPVVAVEEIDSVVTMRSGQVAVMGGLMRDVVTSQDEGLPLFGQLPVVGYLFKARQDQIRKTELVIFLRATILDGDGIDPLDAELYREFSGDRRPFPLPTETR